MPETRRSARELLNVLSDSEQLEAELAAVRADAQAEVSSAAQHEAAARRERLEADQAAETALTGAAQARAAEQAGQRARACRRSARTRRPSACRGRRAPACSARASSLAARPSACLAALSAAACAATAASARAAASWEREQNRDSALQRARAAEHDRDLARVGRAHRCARPPRTETSTWTLWSPRTVPGRSARRSPSLGR
jgi:hypothetical protein